MSRISGEGSVTLFTLSSYEEMWIVHLSLIMIDVYKQAQLMKMAVFLKSPLSITMAHLGIFRENIRSIVDVQIIEDKSTPLLFSQ